MGHITPVYREEAIFLKVHHKVHWQLPTCGDSGVASTLSSVKTFF